MVGVSLNRRMERSDLFLKGSLAILLRLQAGRLLKGYLGHFGERWWRSQSRGGREGSGFGYRKYQIGGGGCGDKGAEFRMTTEFCSEPLEGYCYCLLRQKDKGGADLGTFRSSVWTS